MWAILVGYSLMSGCMVLNKYKNPNTPNAASVTIVTFAEDLINMEVWHCPGEECLDTKVNPIGKLNST